MRKDLCIQIAHGKPFTRNGKEYVHVDAVKAKANRPAQDYGKEGTFAGRETFYASEFSVSGYQGKDKGGNFNYINELNQSEPMKAHLAESLSSKRPGHTFSVKKDVPANAKICVDVTYNDGYDSEVIGLSGDACAKVK